MYARHAAVKKEIIKMSAVSAALSDQMTKPSVLSSSKQDITEPRRHFQKELLILFCKGKQRSFHRLSLTCLYF